MLPVTWNSVMQIEIRYWYAFFKEANLWKLFNSFKCHSNKYPPPLLMLFKYHMYGWYWQWITYFGSSSSKGWFGALLVLLSICSLVIRCSSGPNCFTDWSGNGAGLYGLLNLSAHVSSDALFKFNSLTSLSLFSSLCLSENIFWFSNCSLSSWRSL